MGGERHSSPTPVATNGQDKLGDACADSLGSLTLEAFPESHGVVLALAIVVLPLIVDPLANWCFFRGDGGGDSSDELDGGACHSSCKSECRVR